MIICVDFDGTVVESGPSWSPDEVLRLRPGAAQGLADLKRAGHTLILWSCRANMAQRANWRFDPIMSREGVSEPGWEENRQAWEASYARMVRFVSLTLPGMFDAVDGGMQGKPLADLYLDDRGYRMGDGSWLEVSAVYGVPDSPGAPNAG